MTFLENEAHFTNATSVIPAQAGIQCINVVTIPNYLDPRVRGDDDWDGKDHVNV